MKKIYAVCFSLLMVVFFSPLVQVAHAEGEAALIKAAQSRLSSSTAKFDEVFQQFPNVDINYIDSAGFAAIHYAIGYKNKAKSLYLIEKGCDVNLPADSSWYTLRYGASPIHYAAYYDQAEILQALIASNADINAQDSIGYTPLHHAASYNLPKIAEILLQAGARTDIKSSYDMTANETAISEGNTQIASIIARYQK